VVNALEVANVDHHGLRMQLKGICKGIQYLAEMAYKVYIKECVGTPSE